MEDKTKKPSLEKNPAVDENKVVAEGESSEKEVKSKSKFDDSGIRSRQEEWIPKTELGKKVAAGEITDIDEILNESKKILEYQIVDRLVPNLESTLLNVGQSKGKFGGGKRSIWRQTQKKTKEGNRIKFGTFALVGNKDGYFGIGFAKSKETVPAREKAIRRAKLNLIKVKKGCGSWDCGCKDNHSIAFKTTGKCGSVKLTLMPAPKGTGLLTEKETKKILEFVGIKDVYSKTFGQTKTKINIIKACYDALKNLSKFKIQNENSNNTS